MKRFVSMLTMALLVVLALTVFTSTALATCEDCNNNPPTNGIACPSCNGEPMDTTTERCPCPEPSDCDDIKVRNCMHDCVQEQEVCLNLDITFKIEHAICVGASKEAIRFGCLLPGDSAADTLAIGAYSNDDAMVSLSWTDFTGDDKGNLDEGDNEDEGAPQSLPSSRLIVRMADNGGWTDPIENGKKYELRNCAQVKDFCLRLITQKCDRPGLYKGCLTIAASQF